MRIVLSPLSYGITSPVGGRFGYDLVPVKSIRVWNRVGVVEEISTLEQPPSVLGIVIGVVRTPGLRKR